MYFIPGGASQTWVTEAVTNSSLVISGTGAAITGGDGTLDVFVTYEVITL